MLVTRQKKATKNPPKNINILAGNIIHGLTESNGNANSLSEKTSENNLHVNGTATKIVNLLQSILSDFQSCAGR